MAHKRIIPARLNERIKAEGLTYTAVANELGVTQPTISRLATGKPGSTSRIDQLAHIVRTTPAYLTGETDDPSFSGLKPAVGSSELRVIDELRITLTRYQTLFEQMANSLARKPALSEFLPDEDALAEMFEAMLMTMDREKPLDEQGRLLAQRLPIALSQLEDLQPLEENAGRDGAAAVPVQPKREAVSS